MEGMRYARLSGILTSAALASAITGPPAFASAKNMQVTKAVWKAYNDAYGWTVTHDDIGGLNVGFPGQYCDAETGLRYNGFRDYQATLRQVQGTST